MSQSINPELGMTVKAQVLRVVDGDTVEVEVRRKLMVRLLDCWAPEMKTGDPGRNSKEFMESLLDGKEIYLMIPSCDGEEIGQITFGRVLGRIYVKQEDKFLDVSKESVAHGQSTLTKHG